MSEKKFSRNCWLVAFVRVAKQFFKSEIHRFEYTLQRTQRVYLQEEKASKFTEEFGESSVNQQDGICTSQRYKNCEHRKNEKKVNVSSEPVSKDQRCMQLSHVACLHTVCTNDV